MHKTLLLTAALLTVAAAQAGRPLSVDDANTNDAGHGHVEAWYAYQAGTSRVWTVAPAYAVWDGLEFGAAFARDTTAAQSSQTVQAKWRITPAQDRGCNVGASLGATHTRGAGNAPFANGLLSCNSNWGATHFNLGANRAPGGPTLGAWGIAHEREYGAITAHVEAFGQRLSKPTFQIGVRTELATGLQLDATLGRSNRTSLASIGFKASF
jgi:hypothetical protein